MKKIFLLYILLLSGGFMNSQNLVPNPSFETITQCPPNYNKIYYATPWFQPSIHYGNTTNSSSSDLYNICSSLMRVPHNSEGFQYARTGISYAGIFVYGGTSNDREYIEVPLSDTLVANHSYCVDFYVSLANNYGMAISNMGAYFSVDSLLDTTHLHAINYVTPQVENPVSNMLTDTLNWMLVSGNYIAVGGEKFMTIGNFHLPANTNTQVVPTQNPNTASYYYIDDVSVVDCEGVGIPTYTNAEEIKVFPNPASNELEIRNYELGIKEVSIYNVLGELLYQSQPLNKQSTINISQFPKGIYFVEVQTEKGIVRKKFVKE